MIPDFNLTKLQQHIEQHLKELENKLEVRIFSINKRITSGKNKHVQVKKYKNHHSWKIPYTRASALINHSLFITTQLS